MTSIAVVTPWHNALELADDYFDAVNPELRSEDELIIVDNGSRPPLDFATLTPGVNLGFAGACNLGLEDALADAVLFLNNDVIYTRRGWLDEIREAVAPGVLVGPLRFDPHADVDGHKLPYIDGWCLAGMRDDLLALGGFDTDLEEPAYYSDNLLCLRARLRGMELREVRLGIAHKLNATMRTLPRERVREATIANRAVYEAAAREALSLSEPASAGSTTPSRGAVAVSH